MEELLIIAAAPRSGNHLLRGLLDGHPALLVPPDEDYFVRQLMRSPSQRFRSRVCSPGRAPDLYREIQKNGHFEEVVSGGTRNSYDTAGLLDLDAYYGYVRSHHRRFSLSGVVRTHFEALEAALTAGLPGSRRKVYFCAMHCPGLGARSISARCSRVAVISKAVARYSARTTESGRSLSFATRDPISIRCSDEIQKPASRNSVRGKGATGRL